MEEEEDIEVMKNDPEEMKKAREASWLCNIFQENQLTVEEKKEIFKRIFKETKAKYNEMSET